MMDEILDKDKSKKKHKISIKTDSLLRETSTHYIRLIGDADRKARIMLVVASVLITIGITVLTEALNNIHLVWISATMLIIGNAATLFFAILSIRPELKSSHLAKETENNMLHYKKCNEYSLQDYTNMLINTLEDDEKKRDAIIKELYYYGNLLNMKYGFIQASYKSFLWGAILSISSYLLILFSTHA